MAASLVFMDKKGSKHLESGVNVLATRARVGAAGYPAASPREREFLAECAGRVVEGLLKTIL